MFEAPIQFNLVPSVYDVLVLIIILTYFFLSIKFTVFTKKKLGASLDTTRKVMHLALGSTVIFLPVIQNSLVAFLFVFISVIVWRLSSEKSKFRIIDKETFKIIDRPSVYKGDQLETDLLALSALIMLSLFYFFNIKLTSLTAFICMVWVDGIAGMFGKKFGKHKFTIWNSIRSIEGSSAGFFSGVLVSLLVFLLIKGNAQFLIPFALVSAASATIFEAFSPGRYDNFIPFVGTFAILEILSRFYW